MSILTEQKPQELYYPAIWGWVKKAARWVVKHVKVTKKSISVGGTHDIGGGGK